MLDWTLRVVKEQVLAPLAGTCGHIHPNVVTLASGVLGLVCAYLVSVGETRAALWAWAGNRVLDGLDGVIARRFGKATAFGGYLDILVDFTVYAAVPCGIAAHRNDTDVFFALSLLLSTYFVNAASLFHLSALLERRAQGAAANRELTSVTMPPALIEGTETAVLYFAFIALPHHASTVFVLFAAAVALTTAQRLLWAYRHLE